MLLELLTYISPFSNLFFKFSLIASFEILLINVRSETPTSFFFPLSKTALRTWGCAPPPPPPGCAELGGCFERPARFVMAFDVHHD